MTTTAQPRSLLSPPLSTPPLSTPAPAASRNNPVQLRIYKAIGTSFDDRASREALEIASSFYSSKPTDSEAPAPEFRRTLRGQSAATARKNLKRDVEARLAGGSQRFLEAFGEVDKVSTKRGL